MNRAKRRAAISAFSLAAALLAACAAPPQTNRDLDRIGSDYQRQVDRANAAVAAQPGAGEDQCDAARFQALMGRHQTDIDASALPSGTRILCHDCMATMDYVPARLNIELDEQDRVARIRCG